MPEQISITVVDSGVVLMAGGGGGGGGVTSVTAGTGLTGGIITSSGTIAVDFSGNGVSDAGKVCQANDSRLSNARTPTAHHATHYETGSDPIEITTAQVSGLDTSLAGKASTSTTITAGNGLTGGGSLAANRTISADIAPSGSGSATQLVGATDSRLTDSRTPTTHGSTHAYGNSDAIPTDGLVIAQVSGLATALAGKVPTTRTVTAGTGLTGGGILSADISLSVVYGTDSNTSCVGNDSRLSDSRPPSGAAGGDLSGTYPNPSVAAIRGVAIESASPTGGDALIYVASAAEWQSQPATDVQVFTGNGTWTKPAGCKFVNILCIGAGGGGGSGHASATGNRGGGGGGGGGGITEINYRASALPASLTITVGSGGAGGAGVTANSSGNDGSAGGSSYVAASGITYASAAGGNGGIKGNNTPGAGGAALTGAGCLWYGGAGGAGGSATGVTASNSQGAPGGGGGGGMSSSGDLAIGGNGGTRLGIGTAGSGISGGAGGNYGFYGTGGGGSPSASGTSLTGGSGGYGSGGGGSGGSSSASGNGGSGGGGLVVIVSSW